jgi:transposase
MPKQKSKIGFYDDPHKILSKKINLPEKSKIYLSENNKNKDFLQGIDPDFVEIFKTTDSNIKPPPKLFTTSNEKYTPEESIETKTMKLRILPNEKQKIFLHKCADAHRFLKNLTVDIINKRYASRKQELESEILCCHKDLIVNNKTFATYKNCKNPKKEGSYNCEDHENDSVFWDLDINHSSLRAAITDYDYAVPLWVDSVPYNTRDRAIREVIGDYNSSMALLKNKRIDHFTLGFKSAKAPSKNFRMDNRNMKLTDTGVILYPSLKLGEIKMSNKVLAKLKNEDLQKIPDVNIYCNRGKWYMLLPVPVTLSEIDDRKDCIVFDPGEVVPFAGFIPEDGTYMNIGKHPMKKVAKKKKQIDNLNSKMDTLKNITNEIKKNKEMTKEQLADYKKKRKTIKNMQKRIGKIYYKRECIRDDFHNRTASWISKNFKNVIIPDFGTSKMIEGDTLQSSTKEKLNANLFIVNEAYTSKTCVSCGYVHKTLPGGRDYKCKECGFETLRDFNGAANIYLKVSCE